MTTRTQESGGAFSSQKPRAFLFYVVCDVSRSMHDPALVKGDIIPYTVLSHALPDLLEVLEDDEDVRDIARLSVITFADTAEVVIPLTPVRSVKAIPKLPKGTDTDYISIFTLLNDVIRADSEKLARSFNLYRPVVYFITDGDPQKGGEWQDFSAWARQRERLSDADFEFRPSIVALGMGEVEEANLKRVASIRPPGAACVADLGQPLGPLLESMIESVVASITDSSKRGELVFDTPPGMRRIQ